MIVVTGVLQTLKRQASKEAKRLYKARIGNVPVETIIGELYTSRSLYDAVSLRLISKNKHFNIIGCINVYTSRTLKEYYKNGDKILSKIEEVNYRVNILDKSLEDTISEHFDHDSTRTYYNQGIWTLQISSIND